MRPTTRSNAEALAAAKGYRLTSEPDGAIVATDSDGLRYAATLSWPGMLAWLVRAEPLDDDGAAA